MTKNALLRAVVSFRLVIDNNNCDKKIKKETLILCKYYTYDNSVNNPAPITIRLTLQPRGWWNCTLKQVVACQKKQDKCVVTTAAQNHVVGDDRRKQDTLPTPEKS